MITYEHRGWDWIAWEVNSWSYVSTNYSTDYLRGMPLRANCGFT